MNRRKIKRPIGAMLAFATAMYVADVINRSPNFIYLLLPTVAAFFGAYFLSARAWRWIFAEMLALSVLIALLAVSQIGIILRPSGPFGSPNLLAGYAALHFFLALLLRGRARQPYWCDIAAAANILALLLAQSLGGILACGIGALFLLPPRYQHRIPECLCVVMLLFVAFVFVTPGRPALFDSPRPLIWLYGLRAAQWKLLFGYGQRDFLVPPHYMHFYSSAVACLVAGGLVALTAGIWMLVSALRAAWRWPNAKESRALRGFLVAWIVNGLFIYDTPETVLPLYAVLAFLGSKYGDVADAAALIDHRQPFARLR